MRNRGLHDFGGHFSRACSNRSRARSNLEPPWRNGINNNQHKNARRTYISLHKFGEVNVPNLKGNGESEELHASLVHLEAVLEIFVLFEEGGIVDNDLGVGNTEFQDLVVDSLCRLDSANRLFQVNVK